MKPVPTPNTRLCKIRQRLGLSLEDVARKVHCNRSQVYRWEALLTEPAPPLRKLYAKALEIDVGKLGRIFYEDRLGA